MGLVVFNQVSKLGLLTFFSSSFNTARHISANSKLIEKPHFIRYYFLCKIQNYPQNKGFFDGRKKELSTKIADYTQGPGDNPEVEKQKDSKDILTKSLLTCKCVSWRG
jgi:hypothetical protein